MGYRCCRHCADDPVHDVEPDRHTVPCGGRYGPCPDGGDELVQILPGIIDLTYDADDEWCYECERHDSECTCHL